MDCVTSSLRWLVIRISALVLFDIAAVHCMLVCPGWQGAWYINGKCLKLFNDIERSWWQSQSFCESQIGTRMPEPRTKEEIELLMSDEFRQSCNVMIGAKVLTPGAAPTFLTDGSVLNRFDFYTPSDYRWDRIGCIKIASRGIYNGIHCEYKNGRCAVCEIDRPHMYLVPSGVLRVGSFSKVYAEVMATQIMNGNLTTVWNFYTQTAQFGSRMARSKVFSSTTTLYWDLLSHDFEESQWVVEMLPSHPVTFNLVYEKDNFVYFRPLLHPFVIDIMYGQDCWTRYVLVSSGKEDYFILVVTSLEPGENLVRILFQADPSPDAYILLDSVNVLDPRYITMTLDSYQSQEIEGTVNIDGTRVWATKELAVYVIGFRDVASGSESMTVSGVYQALPSQSASNSYVTVPLAVTTNGTGGSLYKVITIYPETTIQTPDDVYFLARIINGSTTKPNLVTGDKPFHVYKVPETSGEDNTCMCPFIPEMMWSTRYVLSFKWRERVNSLALYLVFRRASTQPLDFAWGAFFGVGDLLVGREAQCLNVTGDTENVLTMCTIEVASPTPSDIIIGSTTPNIFLAAYISWKSSDGDRKCQPLGFNWDGDWWQQAWQPTTQTATPPTTTTTATATAATSTVTPIITDPVDAPPNSSTTLDLCRQTIASSIQTNLSDKEIQGKVASIRKVLHVDATKISSFVRKKTSAKDTRTSSSGIGLAGLVIISVVFGAIFLSDFLTIFVQWLDNRKRLKVTAKT